MKKLSYGYQVLVLGIWIVVVLALFRLIEDKQVAAVFAGAGFILLPAWILYSELTGKKNRIHIFVVAFFLVTSALPIFLLRILNWGEEFASIDMAATLHRISNLTYLAIVVSALVLFRREQRLGK